MPFLRGEWKTSNFEPQIVNKYKTQKVSSVFLKIKITEMSDEEEDYMSDAFLAKLQDVTPSLIKNSSVKRQNQIEMKRKQQTHKKSIHEQTKDKLKEGLNKALTSDNKGFAMLSKMGFKPGTSLGKSSTQSSAIKEPIKININNDGRSGLGTVTAVKETRERQLNNLKRKINASDMTPDEYRKQLRQVSDKKQTVWDLHKLQKTCRIIELEHHVKFPIHLWFWPEDRSKKEESSEEEEEEDESQKKTELSVSFKIVVNLHSIITFCDFRTPTN